MSSNNKLSSSISKKYRNQHIELGRTVQFSFDKIKTQIDRTSIFTKRNLFHFEKVESVTDELTLDALL